MDVSLTRDGRRIACEVAVTSSSEQELRNIEKCLAAGYDTVVLCSPQKRILSKVKALASQNLKGEDRERVLFLQPEEFLAYLGEPADESRDKRRQRGDASPAVGAEVWEERLWHTLRHLDDRSELNQSPLARLAYIERLAEREYKGGILTRGLALRKALIACIDKIIADGGNEPGLQKACEFLRLVKEGKNLTEIGEQMGVSREQVTRAYRKKGVELLTQEFLKLLKTRRRREV